MESLGIDVKIILAQVVNFGILLVILSKVLYKPLIKMLDERAEKIKKSIDNSEKIEKELAKIKEKQDALLKEAKKEALKERNALIEFANLEKTKIINDAKAVAQSEVKKGIDRLKNEEDQLAERIAKDIMDKAVDKMIKKLSDKGSGHPLLRQVLK